MATDRQIDANRRNAMLSTGPTSPEGKAHSRTNALKHGLTAAQIDLDPAASESYLVRKTNWAHEIGPETDEARYALDRAVAASFRIERCEEAFDAMIVEQATRARLTWNIDRRLDAVVLADKLSKKPALVSARLEATRHGCDLKIQMWNALSQTIVETGEWTEVQAAIVLDLLGTPLALRTGRTAIDPEAGGNLLEHRRAVAVRELDRLESLKATALDSLDDLHRQQAEHAGSALLSAQAALISRYERDAWRRLHASLKAARKRSVDEPEVIDLVEVAPKPDPELEPEPIRDPDDAADLEEEAARHRAILACCADMRRRNALATTVEESHALMAEMKATVARLKDHNIPLFPTDVEVEAEPASARNRRNEPNSR